jgi:hypothetical protein
MAVIQQGVVACCCLHEINAKVRKKTFLAADAAKKVFE